MIELQEVSDGQALPISAYQILPGSQYRLGPWIPVIVEFWEHSTVVLVGSEEGLFEEFGIYFEFILLGAFNAYHKNVFSLEADLINCVF